jgi:hypothetical protein
VFGRSNKKEKPGDAEEDNPLESQVCSFLNSIVQFSILRHDRNTTVIADDGAETNQ